MRFTNKATAVIVGEMSDTNSGVVFTISPLKHQFEKIFFVCFQGTALGHTNKYPQAVPCL